MRPTPQEVITGVSRILKETVEPHVHDDHAKNRLREVRAVLSQIDWDDASLHVAEAADAARRVLRQWLTWAGSDPDRAGWFASERTRATTILDEAGRRPLPTTFEERNAQHREVSRLLTDIVTATNRYARESPECARETYPVRIALLQSYGSTG